MKKVTVAVVAGAIAASSGLAEAQSPTLTPAALTAEAAIAAATAAIQTDGKSGLRSAGVLDFTFTATARICPPGFTTSGPGPGELCTNDVSGGFRFIIRVKDIRPGKGGRSVVIGAILSTVSAGKPFSSLTCPATNPADGGGCPLSIRPVGKDILKYAAAHHKPLRTQLIAHVRPSGQSTSTEVIQFLNL